MSTAETAMFPLFAANFFNRDEDVAVENVVPQILPTQARPHSPVPKTSANHSGRGSTLRPLDLQTLPRDDGPVTELRARKEKLAHYEIQCSHVGDCLYVGGEVVAKNRDILRQQNITHVINCVGFLYPAYFEDDLAYQTLYLQDTPGEDILCVLYDVFDFIEGARGGRVFVHCSQGVSRSTTLAIAYRMWKEGRAYEDIFAEVKRMRGVANPNIGFICQLLQWHKRRTDEAAVHRLYRIAPQSPSAPLYLVPKLAGVTPAALDPRGAFVLHAGREVFIWIGAQCPEAFATAARRVAGQLHRYEGASEEAQVVVQGQEPEAFWAALSVPSAAQACTPTTAPSSHRNPGKVIAEGPSPEPKYDRDFDLYTRSLNPGAGFGGPGDSCDSARSGRKTPRDQPEHAASPNDRLRKQARSEAMERERERTARSSGSSYSLGTESARARALDFQELAVRRRAPSPPPLRSPPAAAAAPVPAPVPRLALPKASQAAPSIPEAVASEDSELSNSEEEDSDASETDDEATSSEDEEEDGGPAEAVQRPMGVPRLKLG